MKTRLGAAALLVLIGSVCARDARVEIKEHLFLPAKLTLKPGDTVTWINLDEDPHTVMDKNGAFRSEALDTKDTFSFVFTRPGTYAYFCTLHPMMVGSVKVGGKPAKKRVP